MAIESGAVKKSPKRLRRELTKIWRWPVGFSPIGSHGAVDLAGRGPIPAPPERFRLNLYGMCVALVSVALRWRDDYEVFRYGVKTRQTGRCINAYSEFHGRS